MTPDGSYVVDWSGNGTGDNQGIYFRRYTSTVDTAGPMVTGFLLPNGTPVTMASRLPSRYQPFRADLRQGYVRQRHAHRQAVTNPANYQLLDNGVNVAGGISSVSYGLNEAYLLEPIWTSACRRQQV